MDWVKINWKQIALLCGSLIVMAALITVILLLREEKGLMSRECHAGQGDYGETRWKTSSLPVDVWLASEDAALKPDVQAGIDFWAPYLRWGGIIQPLEERPDPVIMIESFPAPDRSHGKAKLSWLGDCEIRRVEIKVPMPMLSGPTRRCVVAHELGHALGLDHDDDEDSVMSASRSGRFRCEITDHDVELLRSVYGSR